MNRFITFSFAILAVTSPSILQASPIWEPAYGPSLVMYDNDCIFVPLGFSFVFYGETYDGVWVNSNGNVTFDGCNTRWSGLWIPDPGFDIVAPLYGDFDPYMSGDVHAQVLGSPGERRLVVTWHEVPRAGLWDGRSHTFQLQLLEGVNAILFAYNGLQTLGYNRDGSPMVAGISAGAEQYVRSASGSAIPGLDMSNVCYVPAGGGYTEVFGPCQLTVAIDVKPGNRRNMINTRSQAVVSVAILGTGGFSVLDVDSGSLRFGPAEASPVHNLGDPDVFAAHLYDVDGDGRLDLVSHYSAQATGLSPGETWAVLVGGTSAGVPFEGWDSVLVK